MTAADRPSVKPGPWTSHGHDIPGVTVAGTPRPARARCGGPSLCAQCSREAVAAMARPSVTDNARADLAEALTKYEAEIKRAQDSGQGAAIAILAGASLAHAVRDSLAAGRAETTTAADGDAQTGTFEAILAAHRDEYDSDCGMYFGCSCGWDNDDIGSNEGYVEHVAGLLATARTRPTRDEIDSAVGAVLFNAMNHPDPVAVLGKDFAPLRAKITDAVMGAIARTGADQ